MRIRPLHAAILAGPIAQTFFADDDGGGAGGSAVAEPPAPSPNASNTPDADLVSFAPPDPDLVIKAISAPGDKLDPVPAQTKEGAPPAKKPEPVKPPAKKEEPKAPPAKKEGESPVAQLRTEYEATKVKLAEAESKLAAGDPRLKQFEADVENAKKELQEERERREEIQRRLVEYDANNSEEIQHLQKAYDKNAGAFHSRVFSIEPAKVWEFAGELNQIPIADRAKMQEFAAKVNAALGGNDQVQHPHLEKTMDHIEATRDFAVARHGKIEEIKKNSENIQIDRGAKNYKSARARVDSLLEKARAVPEGMEESDPTHPAVILSKVRKEMGDDFKKFDAGLDEFVRLAIAGLPPRTAKDYPGMTDEQIREARMQEASRVEQARDYAVNVMPNAIAAYRVLPSLVREIARLRAKVGEENASEPPDPSKSRESGGQEIPDDDLTNFRPPSMDDIKFA